MIRLGLPLLLASLAGADAPGAIRVVTYNVQSSGLGIVPPNPGFDTVMQAIGNHHLAGNAQPIDVLSLQELDGTQFTPGNSATLPYIVSQLNAIYGPNVYAADTTKNPTTGGTGGGPNGLVYNTATIQMIQAKVVGTASGSGAPRAPMRYQLRPVGYGPQADFYIYVSHYKASSDATSKNRRNVESTTIRADADALGPNAHIIYSGDFNFTSGRSETAYQTLIAAGNGKANDPANPTNTWTNSTGFRSLMTHASNATDIRFDFQFVTNAMLNQYGVQLVPNTYTVFGNNGSTSFGSSVYSQFSSALPDLANRLQVLQLLTTVSDHLPVVADYAVVFAPCPGDLNGDHVVDDADFTIFAAAYDTLTCPASPAPCPADLNSDTMVDDADFVLFAQAYDALVCP
ncbi:MAG: endonuclease/exonuclease/phosphatase family protein [Planctomycetes bacterium]|nr:endonuclease/exonuclease/phosphatase family protein [Planctomycetota bacterium]